MTAAEDENEHGAGEEEDPALRRVFFWVRESECGQARLRLPRIHRHPPPPPFLLAGVRL